MAEPKKEITTNNVDETIELGIHIGRTLKGGEVIALIGELGTGKTHLMKGLAIGMNVDDPDAVTSPTFTLINEYEGALSLYHIDAYRLNSIAEFEMIGFDDYCRADSVVLIEWADRVEPALEGLDWVRIELSHLGPDERALHITNAPEHIKSA